MKKIIYLVIFAAICIMSACNSDDLLNEAPSKDTELKILESKQKAYEVANRVLESFKNLAARSSVAEWEYPNYYGGMYIDEKGYLNILVKGDVNTYRKQISTTADSDDIVLHPCLYSYSELLSVLKDIDSFNISNTESNIFKNFKAVKLDDKNNNIIVELKDCNDSEINDFKNSVTNSPAITFKQTLNEAVEHSLQSGDPVYVSKNDGFLYACTFGYRARLNNMTGWVTSAHAFSAGQPVYNSYNQEIGKCYNSVYQGSVDAAFCVSTNSSYDPIQIFSTSTTNIVAGMAIQLHGYDTGSSYGTILNPRTSIVSESNVYLSDVAFASYHSNGGDSGGAITFNQYGSDYVVGIHHGRYGSDSVIIKESNISSSLGAVLY